MLLLPLLRLGVGAARARHAAGELFAKTTAGHLAEARPGEEERAENVARFLTDIGEEPVLAPNEDAADDFDVWSGDTHAPDTSEAEAEDAGPPPTVADKDFAPVTADADPAVRMMDRLLAVRIVNGYGLRGHWQRPEF